MKLLGTQNLSLYNRADFYERAGYTNIRIPGILSFPDGTVLCCYECRRGGDWSAIDIGMQKSRDFGKTWSSTNVVVSGKGRNAMNNPLLIADGNHLFFFYCENYKRLYYCESENAGDSFSPPIELTQVIEALTEDSFWSVLAVGPGHGISLNDHSLIIPMWFALNRNDIFSHHPSLIRVLKKNPDGTWSLSAPIGANILQDPSECCIAQGADGSIILNIRNENTPHRRALSVSTDNGTSWSEPVFNESLSDPVCCAGLCDYDNMLLFSNCHSENNRENLTLFKIDGSGQLTDRLLISANAGYSDVCAIPLNHTALVAYENKGDITIAEVAL